MERSIRFVIEFTIHEGKLEDVKQMAPSFIELVKAKDAGILSYEFFFNQDKSKFYVLEWYKDSEDALAHMELIKDLFPKLLEISDITRGDIFGNASDGLVQALTPLGAKFFPHWTGFTR